MIRALVTLVFFVGSQGCSLAVEGVRAEDTSCPGLEAAGVTFAFCGEITPFEPFAQESVIVMDRMDEALAMLEMPPTVTENAENIVVSVDAWDEGNPYVGLYWGHHYPEAPYIQLWLTEERQTAQKSAMAHEFWHMYEHLELGVTLDDMYDPAQETHFIYQDLGDLVVSYANDFELGDYLD